MSNFFNPTRRQFVSGTAASAATLGMASVFGGISSASAATFPEHNMNVAVGTRAGGGADRALRAVSSVWKDKLNTNFEPLYYPGASGRVAYEVYMGKREPDCYNLLFGNMGPELLNWVVKKPDFNLDDFMYFGRVDTDPCVVFVKADSKYKTIDDIVAEGKKRKLNVGTSRMAHPASVGILAVGEKTGAQFNLIPLSGGKNTVAGAVTGEMDFSVLTSGSVIAAGEAVRTLLVFNDENVMAHKLNNAPTMNDHFGTKIPPLLSARAFGIHVAAAEKYPDRFKLLQETFKQTIADPALKPAFKKAKGTPEYINYGGIEECKKYAKDIAEIGEQFKSLLTGK